MRVAVLGAGFQGACAALELALRGHQVDLFDRNELPVSEAGYVNEGKIHLGFVYANDHRRLTAPLMVKGAMSFGRLVGRWIPGGEVVRGLSSPFVYAVHRDSILQVEELRRHYAGVAAQIDAALAAGGDYLGLADPGLVREVQPDLVGLDPSCVLAAFQTEERAVDVPRIAHLLRAAIGASPRITFVQHARVTGVTHLRRGLGVEVEGHATPLGRYDHVVNALWGGQHAIDRGMGLSSLGPWLQRFKLGIRVLAADPAASIPSVTISLGRFGDIVRYAGGDLYLSWYPVCMIGRSDALNPTWCLPDLAGQRAIVVETREALETICPPLADLPVFDSDRLFVGGGVILARGTQDIDRPSSGLHSRDTIGVASRDGYHSISIGKYTMAPLLAVEVADRIEGRPPEGRRTGMPTERELVG